jgi:hypothetical protein
MDWRRERVKRKKGRLIRRIQKWTRKGRWLIGKN